MSSTQTHHHELGDDGAGKCSVPMWQNGCPAGFCDKPAYGERPECGKFYSWAAQRYVRVDGRYDGYVPGLACVGHGGPAPSEEVRLLVEVREMGT